MLNNGTLLNNIEDARAMLGSIGRTKFYDLIKERELIVVKIGRRSFITRQSLEAYVERLTESASGV